MKQSERCPKCGSTRIWNDEYRSRKRRGAIIISAWRVARQVTYVCTNCGYSEYYVDTKGLQTIEKHGSS